MAVVITELGPRIQLPIRFETPAAGIDPGGFQIDGVQARPVIHAGRGQRLGLFIG